MSVSSTGTHPQYAAVTQGEARGIQAPVAGIYAPVPANGTSLILDFSDLKGKFIRITATAEDLLYVFVQSTSDAMVGTPTSNGGSPEYFYVLQPGVPDIIGCGTSVRELVPESHPVLLIQSQTGTPGEVRIRRA